MIENYKKLYLIIGKNVKLIRGKRNLTQIELAKKCGKLDRSKISDIENGKEDFMLSTILQICKALDIELMELLQEKD